MHEPSVQYCGVFASSRDMEPNAGPQMVLWCVIVNSPEHQGTLAVNPVDQHALMGECRLVLLSGLSGQRRCERMHSKDQNNWFMPSLIIRNFIILLGNVVGGH